MWRIESGLGISIFFNCLLPTIGWYPLICASLPYFAQPKNMIFHHTFSTMQEIHHMWCFPMHTSTKKYRIATNSQAGYCHYTLGTPNLTVWLEKVGWSMAHRKQIFRHDKVKKLYTGQTLEKLCTRLMWLRVLFRYVWHRVKYSKNLYIKVYTTKLDIYTYIQMFNLVVQSWNVLC